MTHDRSRYYSTLALECTDPACGSEWEIEIHHTETCPPVVTCPHCLTEYRLDWDWSDAAERAVPSLFRNHKLGEEAA